MRAFLFLVLPFTVAAQSPSFQYFEAANQLSQQHINCQQVDDQGFLWIGTQDGLNRFDAYQYQTFWHDKNDTTSLSNHFIWCLLNDPKYGLWIGTYGGGLNYYDFKKETFTSFYPGPENAVRSVRSMAFIDSDTLLVGTDQGYWEFVTQTRQFLAQDSLQNVGLSSVTALYRISSRWLLVGATEGLFLIDRRKQLKQELHPETPIRLVTDIKPIGDEIWVCGSPGLVRLQYSVEDDLVEIIGQSRPKSITNEHRLANACTKILEDDHGTIWVGALGNLYQVKLQEGTLQWVPQVGLPDQQINSLLQIEPNLISIGTREGLLKTTAESPLFQTKTPVNEPNLCSSVILGLDQDSSGDWWIGTKEGLFHQEATGQYSECLSPDNTPGMPVPYVINVRAFENEIWATFWRGGLGRIRPSEPGWTVDTIPGLYDLVKGAGMHDIIKDKAGKYWIASPNRGVIRWDPESSHFKVYEPIPADSTSLSSPYVFHLFFDHKEHLWISTANGGVCRLNPQTELIQCFQQTENSNRSLASNIVLSTYQDQKERIWFCTAAGLSLLLDDGSIRNFGKRDGLPNEVVYGMLEDTQGNLWISTNGGLCRISEESEQWSFQNFTAEDGLQSNEFNQYSFHQSTAGHLYFGGSVGLTQFDPTRVQPSNYHPPLEITRLLLFNKEQQVRSSPVLDQSILRTEGILLAHDQNFLAFEFAALGFQQSQNQVYAYRMIGLEEEWIQAGNRRFASYPNLAPGSYRFEVKAANHDGIWSAETKGIDIYVKQPWWKRWWAILLWTSLLLGLIRMFISNRENTIRRIEQAKLQEREAFRKRSAQDFHDEAGNRITKLSLLTEVAKRQEPAQDAILNQIQEHIQSLRAGMRDFIWVLDPEQDQLADLYRRLIQIGNQLFEHTNIQFHPSSIPEKASTWIVPGYQRRHLLMIFQEAMNNVVKYAQCQNVHMGISIYGNQVSIWLKDDGRGFILGETEGYGIRNMEERAQKIDGKLQIDSILGQQTQVTLFWDIPQMGD